MSCSGVCVDEPNWLLRSITYHFASGDAFYWGAVLLAIACHGPAWDWAYRHTLLLVCAGLLWIVLSSYPGLVLLGLLVFYLAFWLLVATRKFPRYTPEPSARWVVMGIVLIAVLAEYPRSRGPELGPVQGGGLAIVGDSVTAGLNDRDDTWPRQLARQSSVTVFDASQQGATLKSARQQVTALEGQGGTLILEIGGNDLLEGLPVQTFAEDLRQLLGDVRRQGYRDVSMFELPLPPLCQRYGYIQRRLADQNGIRLLPKREWLAVLTSRGGTVDGIHLSDAGQTRLMKLVQRRLGLTEDSPASPKYVRVDRR